MTLHAWWLNMNLRSTVSEGKQAPAPPWSFCLKREGQGPWGVGSAAESALQHQKSCADALSWVHQQAKAKPRTFFRTSRHTSALSLEKKNENARDQLFNNFSPGENKESRRKDYSRWGETTASVACSSTAASARTADVDTAIQGHCNVLLRALSSETMSQSAPNLDLVQDEVPIG